MKMDYEAQEKCLSTKTTKFMEYLIRRGLLPDRNLVDQESAAQTGDSPKSIPQYRVATAKLPRIGVGIGNHS